MGVPSNMIVLIVYVILWGPSHVQMLVGEYLTIEILPACVCVGGGGGGYLYGHAIV